MLTHIGILKLIIGNSQITDSFGITYGVEVTASEDNRFMYSRNQES